MAQIIGTVNKIVKKINKHEVKTTEIKAEAIEENPAVDEEINLIQD